MSSNGAATTVTFDYGTTVAYGSSATATQSPLTAGAANTAVTAPVSGLVCNTLYHFRVNGNNGVGGTINGTDQSFTTANCVVVSHNAALGNLAISGGSLSPAFASGTLSYTDTVANTVTSVTVTPTVADPNATVTVNGTIVASGSPSAAQSLNVGANTITVVVTAQDGTTTQVYAISVTRAAAVSTNADLSAMVMSTGALVPGFSSATTSYSDAVTNGTATITVTPTVADANATVTVNGSVVASGSPSAAIPLSIGDNMITVLVTAQDGSTTRSYTVTVNRANPTQSNNANLSNLAISSGSLTPAFAGNALTYTDAVANAVTSVTVTPTVADATATVTVNGVTVTSGSQSAGLALGVGDNVITVLVTAQDGTTTQSYTVTVNRAIAGLSNNAALANLVISSGTLTPAFASSTLSYADPVANAVTSVTVTPTVADGNATVNVNGTAVASGSPSAAIALNVGANTITVVVTAQDGTTTQSYAVTVNRASATLSNNASLSNLAISSGSLTPAFATGTLTYADPVANAVTSVTVTPTVADANATVTVNGTAVTSGSPSAAIALNVGANTITVLVTAQDGTTTQSYSVTVNRASATLSNNANLSNLTISSGSLTPAFASGTLTYTDAVANGVTTATVTPTVSDANATVTVNGTTVASGSPSAAIALNVGANTITVVVTAQDGTTTQSYTVTVNRASAALSNNANLSNLVISSGTLTPVFASGTLNYGDAVANGMTSVTVTPTVADASATVTVNGTAVTSGSASAAIALNVGANTITVLVTAQDGTTTQSYAVTVNRASAGLSIQTVAFGATPALVLNGTPGILSAMATSGLPVTFGSLTPGVCNVIGGTVTALSLGVCTVTADQAGNGTYAPAAQATQSIKVGYAGNTATGSGVATAVVQGGGANCSFASATFAAPSQPPANLNFPHGVLSFALANCTPGGTVTIQVTYPGPVGGASYEKYGPRPPNQPASWYAMPGAVLSGNIATFSIQDGGIGDDDLAPNGNIVDAGGPALAAAPAGAAPIPTLSEWGLIILNLFLAALATREYWRVVSCRRVMVGREGALTNLERGSTT